MNPQDKGAKAAEREIIAQLEEVGGHLDEPGPALFLGPHRQRSLVLQALRHSHRVVLPRTQPKPAARWIRRGALAFALCGATAAAIAGRRAWTKAPTSAEQDTPSTALPLTLSTGVATPQQQTVAPAEALPLPVPAAATANAAPPGEPAVRSKDRPLPELDLLQQANTLRGRGDLAGAKRLYLQVVREQAGTMAAYVAEVAAAELALRGDPAEALRYFAAARAQRPAGSLALEILQGMAQSERALGNIDEERGILQQLVDSYPNTLAGRNAKQRLEALSPAHLGDLSPAN